MTTVVDPVGAPAPVYNKSGTTILAMAATGTTAATAAPIVAVSGHTVVIASPSEDETGVLLPDAADIGDVVEVYAGYHNFQLKVYASGTLNLDTTGNGWVSIGVSQGAIFRKVSANGWSSVGGNGSS